MNISYRQLVAFLTVVNLQSFTAAAGVLHLTQGAVSALIKELEDQSGFKLFDRTSRSVRLSSAGEEFLPYALRAVEHFRAAQRFCEDLREHRSGQVRVAGAPLIACTLLPRMISAFSQSYPNVTVTPIDVPMAELQARVRRGDADFGLGPQRGIDPELTADTLFTTPVSVVCRPDHPCNGRTTTWKELQRLPVITVGQEHMDYHAMEFGSSFTVSLLVNHVATALGLAAVGRGLVLSGPYVSQLASAYGLVVCPLVEPVLHRKMMIYEHASRDLSPAAAAFKQFLKDYVGANDPNAVH
ncbi:LysR substrate-binding domain-containing protein [Rhodoplanes sp. TEM]|uniref:LysR substrate-binding domain-containing protein n=1 Tax=Rhodoplanes tepidamans TaxID=200616 RepID=A0ABT5JB64_RHOTP|nr:MULTISPECIES: LysR family transcriptional regulator [Rhodoplanes]MDC7786887.1 LysR substrate-binding domain-containing protein [Rhodoplanes tepidamans]MDC7987211.1 LysR substrate-binding domain-containing protein [Rhodoplanes sp. TEM]MDQ0355417.1 DNA-binding transcriptional LysR family regulator [Rhodoplanes tepidamans]